MYMRNSGMESFGLFNFPQCNYFSNQQTSLMPLDAQPVFTL